MGSKRSAILISMQTLESESSDGMEDVLRQCVFSGICYLDIGNAIERNVGHGFALMKSNEKFLSARSRYSMNEKEYSDGAEAGHASPVEIARSTAIF